MKKDNCNLIADLEARGVTVCPVVKGRSPHDVRELFDTAPQLKMLAENRWPDCEANFKAFPHLQRHFIGHLQKNKVAKVVPLVDVIQSIDSLELLEKINDVAIENNKVISFCWQVNVSRDQQKSGILAEELPFILEEFLKKQWRGVKLVGLMTIGERLAPNERLPYYLQLKSLYDQLNETVLIGANIEKMTILSMGTSEDYEVAIRAGANMVRLGSILFEK